MKAICLRCGHTTSSLDAHDEHTAVCSGPARPRQPGVIDIACPDCGAQPGTPCISWGGRRTRGMHRARFRRYPVTA